MKSQKGTMDARIAVACMTFHVLSYTYHPWTAGWDLESSEKRCDLLSRTLR